MALGADRPVPSTIQNPIEVRIATEILGNRDVVCVRSEIMNRNKKATTYAIEADTMQVRASRQPKEKDTIKRKR